MSEHAAGTEGDAMARVKAVYPDAMPLCRWEPHQYVISRRPDKDDSNYYFELGEYCSTVQDAWADAASKLPPQPSRPEPALPELMHADAVTKLELWKQNQALLQQLKALKQSHAALVEAAKSLLDVISTEKGWGTWPRMEDSQIYEEAAKARVKARAALADAEKVTG